VTALTDIIIILFSFILSLGLTVIVRRWLVKRAILDRPNERSSHTIPTPRGGGWALLGVLIPGLMINAFATIKAVTYSPLIIGIVLLAIVSWLDDRRGLSARLRLGVHIVAAILGSLALPDHATLFGGALPFVFDRMIMIIGWVWFMNLTNFMDGIDGISGVESIALATGTCLVMTIAGIDNLFVANLTLIMTGACLGFLALNWHPAKIFMGDIGSIPLGYLGGFILITLATHGLLMPALILPLYYLADSGITITQRTRRGEKIWQAHRQHFYQRAAMGLGRHDRVVYGVIAANAVLIAATLFAINYPLMGLLLGITVVAILLGWMHKVSRT
jgi:UDP-N-acetylmuramyl pentapeptide phosphotransferase/UDP-N-acetylglucosamine-1-phosphate transferase